MMIVMTRYLLCIIYQFFVDKIIIINYASPAADSRLQEEHIDTDSAHGKGMLDLATHTLTMVNLQLLERSTGMDIGKESHTGT